MRYKRRKILSRIKKYTRKSRKEIITLIIMNALAIPITLISPYIIKIFIDNVLYGGQTEIFVAIVLGSILIYLIRLFFDLINLRCSNKILNRFTYSLRRDIWNKILRLDFSEYEKNDIGDLKMRVYDDVDCLGNFLNDQVVLYYFNMVLAICTFGLSLYTNYQLSLLCMLVFPIVFFINNLIGRGIKNVNEKIRVVNKEYNTFEFNCLQLWKEIKAHNVEKECIDEFKYYRHILAKLGYKNIRYWFFSEVFSDIKSNYLTKILIYLSGSFWVLDNKLTMGSLVLLSEYFGLLFTSLDTVNNKRIELKENTPYYKRIFDILDRNENGGKIKIALEGNISIQNLSFKYDNQSSYILENINAKINHGEYAAITGESGCGKTTLLKLILNMYRCNAGTIRIDNIDIATISEKSLYSQIGMVMQDLYLFNISIKENLLLANRDASMEDLKAACMKTNIHDYIVSLPEKYDTNIGERGLKLSGGQKQRIAIAQALLKNPKIFIFDESTSSLDKISKDAINSTIDKIAGAATVLIVSHNHTDIVHAERIMELKKFFR